LWMFNKSSLCWVYMGGPQTNGDNGNYTVMVFSFAFFGNAQGQASKFNWPSARFGGVSFLVGKQFWMFGGTQSEFHGTRYH
jgi:hypothetical protein